MSYDLRLCLPEEGRSKEEIATADVEESPDVSADSKRRRRRLAEALVSSISQFSADEDGSDDSGIELAAFFNGVPLQILIGADEVGMNVPYGSSANAARDALAAMFRCATIVEREGGFFTYDPQLGRVLDLSRDFDNVLDSYGRVSARAVRPQPVISGRVARFFPKELDRLPYLLRWLVLSATALALIYAIMLFTRGTGAETLTLVPMALWIVVKLLVLDPARLRALGWPSHLTFISLFPPAGLFLQLLLFFLSSRIR